jgi:hypothetical protein
MRTTIYSNGHQEIGYVDDDTVYTRRNKEVGEIKGNEVYKKGNSLKRGTIKGDDIYMHSPYFRVGRLGQFKREEIWKSGGIKAGYSKGNEPAKAAAALLLLFRDD